MQGLRHWTAWAFLGGAVLAGVTVAAHDAVPVDPGNGERPAAVLDGFPLDAAAYKPEAAALVRVGIPERYGHEEWAAVVFTHEFHQHVGIYTVVGAKMAVRARQILGAPMRAVRVTSETGRKQPLACTLDGFQAAIGSTLGQNLIDAPETDSPEVAASFAYQGRKVRLCLKDEYVQRIAGIIQKARDKHGDLTPAYFEDIEAATFQVWADFDRGEIFTVEETLAPVR